MNRAEFEARLLRDPELRLQMEKVEKAAKRLRQAQEELLIMGAIRDYGIVLLANEGVPLAAIARLVDLTPQRLGVIVQAVTEKATEEGLLEEDPKADRAPWPIQALKRSLGLPDDAPDQQVFDAFESQLEPTERVAPSGEKATR
jgi:hypothetical protein